MTASLEKQLMAQGLEKLFTQRETFIVIGLTGRTGSGCSTAADLLESDFDKLKLPPPNHPMENNGDRKYGIVYEWARKKWRAFTRINVSAILFASIVKLNITELSEFIKEFGIDCPPAIDVVRQISSKLVEYDLFGVGEFEPINSKSLSEYYSLYFDELPAAARKFREEIFKISGGAAKYTLLMQKVGDNIRRSGESISDVTDPSRLFYLPECINRLIKIGRKHNKIDGKPEYFVIDAIRNPYESLFFKERFSAFYLFAITTPEESRVERLHDSGYTSGQISQISDKEYPKKQLEGYSELISQNIEKCIQASDVIIENPPSDPDALYEALRKALVKYVSLMQHPGLISPDSVERCMQVAITAKLNSGCISRQVGACITDEEFAVKAIGWNSVPQGQVPCNLRNVKRIDDGSDRNAFSEFERKDEKFKKEFHKLGHFSCDGLAHEGRPLCYCFKSVYNNVKKEKNQVHTRALHGEENAFLQLAKSGGTGIKGGCLFVTASPCELCSKKAYQLGISKIFYIDPYPGIARSHILSCGERRPNIQLFTGAVGRAYVQLYQPLIPLKDELQVLMAAAGC